MEKRTKVLRLVLSDDEHMALDRSANRLGLPLAAWARSELLKSVGFYARDGDDEQS